jgi:hypothetical protein
VEAAMRLEEKDLKLMSRLVRSQFRRIQGGAAAEIPGAMGAPEQLHCATA